MSDYTITLFEACEYLNRSKKSISRYVRRGLLHPEKVKSQQGTLEYRFSESDLKTFKEKENQTRQDREDTGDRTDETGHAQETTPLPGENKEKVLVGQRTDETRQDRTDETEQTGHTYSRGDAEPAKKDESVLTEPTTEETGHQKTEETGQDTNIIALLKETTGLLKDQLKVKDDQIKDLGGKIDQLIERDRETNILLKGLQDKVLMLEKPQTQEATTGQTGQDRTEGGGGGETVKESEPAQAPTEKPRFWKRLF